MKTPELLPCREAFEKWENERRIIDDEPWDAWQACWNIFTTTSPPVKPCQKCTHNQPSMDIPVCGRMQTDCTPCGPPAWESYTEIPSPPEVEKLKHDAKHGRRYKGLAWDDTARIASYITSTEHERDHFKSLFNAEVQIRRDYAIQCNQLKTILNDDGPTGHKVENQQFVDVRCKYEKLKAELDEAVKALTLVKPIVDAIRLKEPVPYTEPAYMAMTSLLAKHQTKQETS